MGKEQLYILKVALSHDKRTYRRIEILGNQSLDQLHETIFHAFDRYDPHLYSFYLTKPGSKARNRFSDAPEYTTPYAIESNSGWTTKRIYDASKTKLSDLDLKVKGKFEYLFDFGDSWLHEITVEKILDLFPDKKYPIVTTKRGESPPQYPEIEEDEDYELCEEEYGEIRKANNEILLKFGKYLASKNLSTQTIDKHLTNIEFYINDFLLYEEPLLPAEGVKRIDYFLGFWFIRKAMWASVTSIKDYIASLKHFYTFMCNNGHISREELEEMKEEIKQSKNEWIETLKKYDDPNASMEDIW